MTKLRHCELSQPTPDGTRAGKPLQPAEALKHRIALHKPEVAHTTTTDYEQTNQKTDHSHDTKIRPPTPAGKGLAYQPIEAHHTQVPAEQLQPGIGRQSNISEFQLQISVDTSRQIGFSSSHIWWPFVEVKRFSFTRPFGLFQFPPEKCHIRVNCDLLLQTHRSLAVINIPRFNHTAVLDELHPFERDARRHVDRQKPDRVGLMSQLRSHGLSSRGI